MIAILFTVARSTDEKDSPVGSQLSKCIRLWGVRMSEMLGKLNPIEKSIRVRYVGMLSN